MKKECSSACRALTDRNASVSVRSSDASKPAEVTKRALCDVINPLMMIKPLHVEDGVTKQSHFV